jgi:hypothetical protein
MDGVIKKLPDKDYCKLVVCVFACATIPEYKNEILKIEETWGKCASENGVNVLYFLGEELTDLQDESKFIYLKNVGNDYASASHKQNLGLKYIYDNYNTDFVFCCGTDTYINIPKLLLYINLFDCNKPIYIGGHGCERKIGNKTYYYHCGGAGFIITKCCLNEIQSTLPVMFSEWSKICLDNQLNITNACDTAISYFLINKFYNSLIIVINNSSFFSCNYNGVIRHGKSTYYYCCSEKIKIFNIISCHSMSPIQFDEFNKILIDNNYFLSNMFFA